METAPKSEGGLGTDYTLDHEDYNAYPLLSENRKTVHVDDGVRTAASVADIDDLIPTDTGGYEGVGNFKCRGL